MKNKQNTSFFSLTFSLPFFLTFSLSPTLCWTFVYILVVVYICRWKENVYALKNKRLLRRKCSVHRFRYKKNTLINLFRFVPTVYLLCDENKYFRFFKHVFTSLWYRIPRTKLCVLYLFRNIVINHFKHTA